MGTLLVSAALRQPKSSAFQGPQALELITRAGVARMTPIRPIFFSVFLLQTVFVAFEGANCEPMPRARAPYHMWRPSSVGQGFPRDRRIPYHMPGLMDALRTFGVGYKRQADRGKRAAEEEMGLIFPPAYIHDNAGIYWSTGERDGE